MINLAFFSTLATIKILGPIILIIGIILPFLRHTYYYSSSLTSQERRNRRAGASNRMPWYIRMFGGYYRASTFKVGYETSRRLNGSGTDYGITVKTVGHEIRVFATLPDADDRTLLYCSHPFITHAVSHYGSDGFSWACWSRSSLSDDLDVLVEEEVLMVDEAKHLMEEYDQARIKLRSKMLKIAKEVEGRRLNSDPSLVSHRFAPQIQARAWELWRGRPVDVLAILASGNITDVEAVAYSNINLQQLVKDAYPET
jgi:hypothetical protein